MKSALLLGSLVLALGCQHGAVIPNCNPPCGIGFQCSLGMCQPDALALWTVTIEKGTIQERNAHHDAWDAFGGAPDPSACLTIAGQRTCTSTVRDSFLPMWFESLPPMTASTLLSSISVEIWDRDASFDDPICRRGEAVITKDDLAHGIWHFGCELGRVDVRLVPFQQAATAPSGRWQ